MRTWTRMPRLPRFMNRGLIEAMAVTAIAAKLDWHFPDS